LETPKPKTGSKTFRSVNVSPPESLFLSIGVVRPTPLVTKNLKRVKRLVPNPPPSRVLESHKKMEWKKFVMDQ